MKAFALALNLLLLTLTTFAQAPKTIEVQVQTAAKQPIENATAELLRASDSALVKATITDKTGVASWESAAAGNYLVRVSSVGYEPYLSAVFQVQAGTPLQLPAILLAAQKNTQMQGVTVTAKKPFIQKLNDRIVVNVESSIISAGSSAIDVLERSPGVTIDQNDIISLRGRSGVIIMIDGKPTPMTGADLANYLRGLPSNAIERIDIITNPSSRYDAAGNSGIIDIRMKKDQRLGANGTLTAGYSQGIYPKANGGATFNYRNKKVNLFGNYNYAYRQIMNHLFINRNFYEKGVFKGSDDKDNYAVMQMNAHTTRVGADFFPSKKSIIGIVVNSNFNKFGRTALIKTDVNDPQYQPDFMFTSIGTNDDSFGNTVANINFKHSFDSTGRELTADVDYGVFDNRSLTRTASRFYNLNGTPKREDDILDGDQTGKLILRTAKADYVQKLKGSVKMETGFKTSYVSSDNDARFFNVYLDETVVDDTKTNRFFYKEYNNAAYLNLSKEYKKFNLQVGLRGEQTNVRTRQQKNDQKFQMDYFQLFPSAFFNYKLKEDQTLGLSVSRRIDRPGYSQLNPFLFQIDATIYSTGSPNLKPQFTWSYEANYTVKQVNFTLGYSHTTNPHNMVLSKILDVIPNFEIKPGQDSNITVQIPVNLKASDYIGLTATVPVKIASWWNMMNNAEVFYNHFSGNLGGAQLSNGKPAANLRTNNTFTFKKGWQAELNANYNSGGQYGYMVVRSQWGLATGVQKQIIKGKGTLRANFTDLFWTNRPRARVEYEGSYIENWHAYRDSRVASLTFTYRFGNSKVQQARRRTTASEEETRRAGN
ncbi:TonB-dependent Receptor Plug Domain [Cnuella takakiae]|uniref:TonB-dependent Receptor Plug Domain n=1 Tax=Cnuella takakiae TaxID=1302690 RepID=A0A1M5D7F5_9BACT|nr:TonB-dependent receptor [Cnuella takakiae]OLY94995.1 hypothetical protein BUE76_20990 [Cnuella takakiae]SHF62602.1 TonB-dependent Receptor Plug Domain [Cnuella takakiae]